MILSPVVDELERRGLMYVAPYTFDTVTAFLGGYNSAMVYFGKSNELDAFDNWLEKRVGHHCALCWSGVITDLFANGDKDLALKRFFELFHEFEREQTKSGDSGS